jgi:threonyl-tRNA synthetase
VELDMREEKLGYKIREAQTEKIPFALVVGDKEMENNAVNVRRYGEQDQVTVSQDDFIALMKQDIEKKSRKES